jgi:pimeloyl-ACP methyl ester carboxylesterase
MRENMIRGMFVPETPPELQRHILDMMLGAPEATAAGAMGAMFNQGAGADGVVQAPALAVVAGSSDLPNLESMRQVVPNFEATQVPGTGHFLMMEKPAEFNQLLEGFLERIDF